MIQNEIKIHQLIDTGVYTYYVDHSLDLTQSESIVITKSIIDIRNFESRKSDYTKTITLPATSNNNKVFNNIFELNRTTRNTTQQNFYPDFNPNLKADVSIYKNGIVQMSGYMQLVQINVVDEQPASYEVIVIGRFANLIQDLGDRLLTDLDLSDYDHVYDITAVEDSWTAPTGLGYYYPLINVGDTSGTTGFKLGNFKPATYLKTLVDRIFSEAGYRYSSNFFDSAFFKTLVMPFGNPAFRISEAEVTNRTFIADQTSPTLVTLDPLSIFNRQKINFDNIIQDSSPAGYDTGNAAFVVQDNGLYAFRAILNSTIENTTGPTLSLPYLNFGIYKNGVVAYLQNVYPTGLALSSSGTDVRTFDITSGYINCVANDIITIEYYSDAFSVSNWTIEFDGNSYFTCIPQAAITSGSTISLSATLPLTFKQTDLLISLIRMFNLYVEVDKYDDRKLIIEPKEQFYQLTKVDLTPYVDVSVDTVIKPIGALEAKTYNYKWKEDKDLYNSRYFANYKYPYGTRRFDVENQFNKAVKDITCDISPTPLVQLGDKIVSNITLVDTQGAVVQGGWNPRILINGGLMPTSAGITIDGTPYTDYPYAGHLDDPFNPTFDLNWGIPAEIYFNISEYPNNNLFNKYHKQGVLEISDKDSKIVEFKMKLNEVQLNALSFRLLYYIDQNYYRLYNVEYDINSNQTTTVQFLQLTDIPVFVGVLSPINGGGFNNGGGTDLPLYGDSLRRDGNGKPLQQNSVSFGIDNNIGSNNAIVNSRSNNVVSDYANVLNGQSNVVQTNDVTLINTSDYVTTLDGEVAINDIQYPFTKVITLNQAQLDALHTTSIEIVPTQTDYIVQYVSAYAQNNYGTDVYHNHNIIIHQNTTDTHIAELKGIAHANETCIQNAKDLAQPLFTTNGLYLKASANLAGGDGTITFTIQYRLIKI
jgi:hypothetical protein